MPQTNDLQECPLREVLAGDANGKSEVILDPRRGTDLPAERESLNQRCR